MCWNIRSLCSLFHPPAKIFVCRIGSGSCWRVLCTLALIRYIDINWTRLRYVPLFYFGHISISIWIPASFHFVAVKPFLMARFFDLPRHHFASIAFTTYVCRFTMDANFCANHYIVTPVNVHQPGVFCMCCRISKQHLNLHRLSMAT